MFVKRRVIYLSKGGLYVCQKDCNLFLTRRGNIFAKRTVIYLSKVGKYIWQKDGNIFVKRRGIYLLKGICQKEG